MYFYEALCDAAPLYDSMSKKRKAKPYSSEPYQLKSGLKKEKDENKPDKLSKGDAKAKSMMEAFMVAHNKRFEQKKRGDMNGR